MPSLAKHLRQIHQLTMRVIGVLAFVCLPATAQPNAENSLQQTSQLAQSQPQQALAMWQAIDPHQLPTSELARYFSKGYMLLRNQGQRQSIAQLLDELHQFQQRVDSPSLAAIAQLIGIEELRLNGKLFEAQYRLLELAHHTLAWNNDYSLLLFYEESSEVHKDLGQLDQAAAALNQAFKWLDNHGRSQEFHRTRLLISSATLLRRSGNYAEARLNVQSALELARQDASALDEIAALIEVSQLDMAMGQWTEVVDQLQVALTLAQKSQSTLSELQVLSVLANVHLQQKQPYAVRQYSGQAIALAQTASLPVQEHIARCYLAMADIQDGKLDAGLAALAPALAILSESDNFRMKMRLLGQLADVLAEQQAFGAALDAMQAYRRTSDELQQTNQKWLLRQYQTRLEADRLRQEAEDLALRNRLKQAQIEQSGLQQQRLLLMTIILLLALLVLGLTAQRLRSKNQHLRLSNRQLARKSRTDRLTGLMNREALLELLFAQDRQRRHEDQQATDGLVLLMDVDHFKQVNDTWGHAAGDEVLVQVAQALTQALRATDRVARWGGEEFVIVAPGADLQQGLMLADKLLHAVHERETLVGHRSLRVSATVGFATLAANASQTEFEHQLAIADAALYYGKQQGRNRAIGVLSHQLGNQHLGHLTETFERLLEQAKIQIATVLGPELK